MAKQEQVRPTEQAQEQAPQEQVLPSVSASELDQILDDIDQELSTGAEEFVKSYVQQGGQ